VKISTKGRYGLRAMIDLAVNGTSGTPVFLSDIAKRQAVSEKYLEHIFSALNKGGIVKAQRGRKGGYLLDRSADRITILDIITVLEGPCTLVDCVQNTTVCDKSSVCVTRDIWNKTGAAIRNVLSSYTLASLVEMQELKGQQDSMMYYI
jgi:Rrf2 family cysteine metabolism transcriptional repressor